MIIKRIESTQRRRSSETTSYIMDKAHEGEKLLAAQAVNCFSENLDDAQKEMSADETAYSGKGNAVAHWVVSWQAGENPTSAQMEEFAREFLKDQGMEGHKACWALHGNTEHTHGHIAVLRVKPEPEPDGGYKLQNFGSRVARENGTSHEVLSARATVIDFCAKYGFTPDFEEVKKPRNADAIRLSQKIEAAEAQNGHPHPKRLIAEKARDIIRSANSWGEMQNNLIKQGISFHREDNAKPEAYKQWGVLKGPEGEHIPLFLLPKDCSLKSLEKRFGNQGESFEAPKTTASKAFYEKSLTANSAKFHARKILSGATTFAEAEKLLGEKGMTLERQGKSGCYLKYGVGENDKMKISALGGKYSLSALSKKYADSDHILSLKDADKVHGNQGKVNGLSMESASKSTARAESRVTHAAERAASTAAEGVQAKTLSEALDDAFAQATALDALRKAKSVAAEAQQRASEMEERAKAAEQALNTQQNTKENDMLHAPEKQKPKIASEAPNASMPVDSTLTQSSDPASVHPQVEQPLKTEKTVEATPDVEKQAPRRKFSFGNTIGKAFGTSSSSGQRGPRM